MHYIGLHFWAFRDLIHMRDSKVLEICQIHNKTTTRQSLAKMAQFTSFPTLQLVKFYSSTKLQLIYIYIYIPLSW